MFTIYDYDIKEMGRVIMISAEIQLPYSREFRALNIKNTVPKTNEVQSSRFAQERVIVKAWFGGARLNESSRPKGISVRLNLRVEVKLTK